MKSSSNLTVLLTIATLSGVNQLKAETGTLIGKAFIGRTGEKGKQAVLAGGPHDRALSQ
jgi:hypothetical protein